MQRGSRISITPAGVLSLSTGSFPEFRPGVGPALHLGDRDLQLAGYEQVFDLAVAGDRVVTLVEGDAIHNLPYRSVAITNLGFAAPAIWTVTRDIARVAVTDAAVFTANGEAIYVQLGSGGPGPRIHGRLIDIASTASQLAVLDDTGAQFFDATGVHLGSVRLFAPTAIAVDRIQPGWLVAIDGGVFHVDGPGDVPHLLAPVAEPVAKVRRDRDTVYVRAGATLQAIRGEHVEVLGRVDDNAWYWNDFDAGPDGLELAKPLD